MAWTMHGDLVHTELGKLMLMSWVSDICLVQQAMIMSILSAATSGLDQDLIRTCPLSTTPTSRHPYKADKLTIHPIKNLRNRFCLGTSALHCFRIETKENCRGAFFDVLMWDK